MSFEIEWQRLKCALQKTRLGDAVPTFHNLCGRRTTYVTCRCTHCGTFFAAQTAHSRSHHDNNHRISAQGSR